MLKRLRRVGLISLAVALLLGLTVTSTLAAPSSARISAHLTKTSFKSSQAGSVKLIYSFSARSRTFSYLLSFKKGKKWQTVKSVKQRGSFAGSKKMTVKKVFAGKPVKVGSYKLMLSVDGGHKTLAFKVIKPSPPPPPCTSDACLYTQG